eukprot:Pgem_evm1s17790
MDFFINFVGNAYLKKTVGPKVNEIMAGNWNCEIDPQALLLSEDNIYLVDSSFWFGLWFNREIEPQALLLSGTKHTFSILE